jgi:hypothetical protein
VWRSCRPAAMQDLPGRDGRAKNKRKAALRARTAVASVTCYIARAWACMKHSQQPSLKLTVPLRRYFATVFRPRKIRRFFFEIFRATDFCEICSWPLIVTFSLSTNTKRDRERVRTGRSLVGCRCRRSDLRKHPVVYVSEPEVLGGDETGGVLSGTFASPEHAQDTEISLQETLLARPGQHPQMSRRTSKHSCGGEKLQDTLGHANPQPHTPRHERQEGLHRTPKAREPPHTQTET